MRTKFFLFFFFLSNLSFLFGAVIEKSVKKLEKNIQKKNEKYLEIVENQLRVEEEIKKIEEKKKSIEEYKKEKYKKFISSIFFKNRSESIIVQKILNSHLSESKEYLEKLLSKEKEIQKKYFKKKSEFLRLELKKESLFNEIHQSESRKATIFSKAKIEEKTSLVRNSKFPVLNYKSVKELKEGKEYFIENSESIFPLKWGKVAYLSDLGSEGKILILEHENQIYSVYLGHFNSYFTKGDKVQEGQILASIKGLKKGSSKLYVEIRKKEQKLPVREWKKYL